MLQLEDEIEQMWDLEDGLTAKDHVLNMCRLMVRAEDMEHRMDLLQVIEVFRISQLSGPMFCNGTVLCIPHMHNSVYMTLRAPGLNYRQMFWN